MSKYSGQPQWLAEISDGPWLTLAQASRNGLPVPPGIVVRPAVEESLLRQACGELQEREHTCFMAVRGPLGAILDVLGADRVLHRIKELWTAAPAAALLIQRMVHAEWCGTAAPEPRNANAIRILANEGMEVFTPDSYLFNRAANRCTRTTMQQRQLKRARHVDGTSLVVENFGARTPLDDDRIREIVDLMTRAQGPISWARDDNRLWLLSDLPVNRSPRHA